MPSTVHEGLIHLFHNRPDLATTFLSGQLGVTLPPHETAELNSADLAEVTPTEFRADAVVTLKSGRSLVAAVVVEIQLRDDKRKRYTWPVYLSTLRARLRCPAMLLVVCPTEKAAVWCSEPIECGHPDWTLRPLVVGPQQIPVINDPLEAGGSPELTMMSAVAHGAGPEGIKVLHAVVNALGSVDEDQGSVYYDVVQAALPQVARDYLEKLMTRMAYEFRSEIALRYQAEGKVKGEADALLTILDARRMAVSDEIRGRIMACRDLDQLKAWIRKALTITSAEELF